MNTGMNSGMNTGNTYTQNEYGTTGSTNAGSHNSNVANKVDPRVDSDLGKDISLSGLHDSQLIC